ncbi:Fur family transcriptional regulator [Bacillus tuaregi]|uniref:Fur family transcriptional regulator n=1 Tax=Bacillus tuaregi TaxID=1816695 RepID=UPI0008F880AF|nr:Fur family transcriptional regulator [Bacillus tuaregi]
MDVEDKISRIIKLLTSKGYKATASRSIIIKLFVESTEHLRPEQIYLLTKEHGVSLPTVYRNIDVLKKMGVINEVIMNNSRYYELSMFSKKKLHMHFQCKVCGQIKEYSDSHIFNELIEQRDYVEEIFNDDIDDIMMVMSGICSSCKNNKQLEDDSNLHTEDASREILENTLAYK